MAENLPHKKSHVMIVTKIGGIVDAMGPRNPWTDTYGHNHEPGLNNVIALLEDKLEMIESGIMVFGECFLARALERFIAQKMDDEEIRRLKEEQAAMMRHITNDISDLASQYRRLETKTKTSVQDIRSYGAIVIEAAEDFLEDENLSDFWREMSDMSEAEKSLKEATEMHNVIIGEVNKICERAEVNASKIKKRTDKALDRVNTMDSGWRAMCATEGTDQDLPSLTYGKLGSAMTIPVFGQVWTGADLSVRAAKGAYERTKSLGRNAQHEKPSEQGWEDWDWWESQQEFDGESDNLITKVIAGGAGLGAGCVGAVAGVVGSALVIPMAPLFWFMAIRENKDMNKIMLYTNFEQQFKDIVTQMTKVGAHLNNIYESLGNIGSLLKEVKRYEKLVVTSEVQERERKCILKIRRRAEKLIEACDKYFELVSKANLADLAITQQQDD